MKKNMNKIKILAISCIILMFCTAIPPVKAATSPIIIKVAIYNVSNDADDEGQDFDKSVTGGMKLALNNYQFTKNGKTYKFVVTIMDYNDVINSLSYPTYKIFVAPGDNDYWEDQYNHPSSCATFRSKIRNFVSAGGGYVGTCGGASIACTKKVSTSPVDPSYKPPWLGSSFLLKMVDATAFNRIYHEQQYVWSGQYGIVQFGHKCPEYGAGGIPVRSYIYPSAPFSVSGYRSIRYWGGPAFKNLGSGVQAWAYYVDEPSDIAPIHVNRRWWAPRATDPWVETDIKSKYSIIAATYGNGKLVLFGQHPEVFTWEPKDANDYVWENYWHNKYKWYGDKLSNSYNYILIREAARWTLGLL